MPKFLSLLSDNIVHEINQGRTEIGKTLFKKFMEDQFAYGKIKISDLIILTSPDGKYATSRFNCAGTYVHTELGYPPATGQRWEIPVVTFFKIDYGKISHVAVIQDFVTKCRGRSPCRHVNIRISHSKMQGPVPAHFH